MMTMAILWEYTVVTVISHKLLVHIKITAENNTHLLSCPLKTLTTSVTVMDWLHYCTYVILLAYSAVYCRTKCLLFETFTVIIFIHFWKFCVLGNI